MTPGRNKAESSAKMGSVSDFLVIYLDAIDEALLDYLDENDELNPEVVKRLRNYAAALLDGSVSPGEVAEDWEDWFDLVGAFVAAYAPEQLQGLHDDAPFMEEPESVRSLSDSDRVFLRALETTLGMYPEMRDGEVE